MDSRRAHRVCSAVMPVTMPFTFCRHDTGTVPEKLFCPRFSVCRWARTYSQVPIRAAKILREEQCTPTCQLFVCRTSRAL